MPAEATRRMDEGTGRAGYVHEGRKVRPSLDGHAHERRFAHRLAQLMDEVPQPARVVGRGDDRAPAGSGAGDFAVSVGDLGTSFELQRCVRLEEGNHAWCGLQEGLDPGLIEVVA